MHDRVKKVAYLQQPQFSRNFIFVRNAIVVSNKYQFLTVLEENYFLHIVREWVEG